MQDLYLAAILRGYASQLNIELLEQYLETNPSDFSFKADLQATINYAKKVQQKGTEDAN